jgi:hypothetical protein
MKGRDLRNAMSAAYLVDRTMVMLRRLRSREHVAAQFHNRKL